jgi:hypothetical protein
MTKRVSVLKAATAKLGVHKGALAAAHIAQWALATAELGHVPTTVEYAEFWFVDERTGWRHRADCRDVLGENWQDVVLALAAAADRRSTAAVVALPVPA